MDSETSNMSGSKGEDGTRDDMNGVTTAPNQSRSARFSFWMSLLSLALTSVIISWDATSLAIALPTIVEDLNGTTLESFWANITFILGVAITQPIYVSLSDVLGRKPPLFSSMILVAIGTVIFATARHMNVLIVGRLIQGIGCGGLDVLEEIIVADMTSMRERSKYLGIIAAAIAIGSITGPIVGALFTEYASWRWIGWINLPIIGASFALALFFLHLKPIDHSMSERLRQLDWTGMILYAVGSTLFALPLSWADALYPWSSWQTIVPLLIGVILLVIFGRYERKPSQPLLPYRVFGNRTAVSSLISGMIHGVILYTLLQYLPLFFQAAYLQTPLEAGVTTLPLASSLVAFSIIAPITVELTRRYRLLIWIGWVITVISFGTWYQESWANHKTPHATTYVIQVFLGVGVGIVYTTTQTAVQASVTHVDDTGLAVGMLVVLRMFGALVGLALSATLFSSVFQSNLSLLGVLPEQASALQDVRQAINFLATLRTLDVPESTLQHIIWLYQKSFAAIWLLLLGFSGLGLLVSLALQELTIESDELGRQRFEQPVGTRT